LLDVTGSAEKEERWKSGEGGACKVSTSGESTAVCCDVGSAAASPHPTRPASEWVDRPSSWDTV